MRTVCAAFALLFAFSLSPVLAQQSLSELQQAEQDASDAKLMLGNADIQNARQRHVIEMLQARNDALEKQLNAAEAKAQPKASATPKPKATPIPPARP